MHTRTQLAEQIQQWMSQPLGQLLLEQEQQLLAQTLPRYFGAVCLHYGFQQQALPASDKIQRFYRIGPGVAGASVQCAGQAWPFCESAADLVVIQHGLEFAECPHALLREAAFSVRPGGHLLITGLNPWSLWGASGVFSHEVLGQAKPISVERLSDWLSLLGFALEGRRFGCYRPPLAAGRWPQRFTWLEPIGQRWQIPFGGFYLLRARKMVLGMRPPLLQPQARLGQLLPMPVAKLSRRDRPL